MCNGLRHLLVCFLTVAFVFSGAPWQSCIEVAPAQAAPVAATHDHQHDQHHAKAAVADHDYGAGAVKAASTQAPIDHTCLKCCGVCTAVSSMPALSATPVIFSAALISFRTGEAHLTGHVVALDPGIPKSIV